MSVSNKTLSILLLAAIVVSLGGTFISLNRLGAITPTGYTPHVGEGTVNLTIEEVLSITTTDNDVIDFGFCELTPGEPLTINSKGTGNAACDGFTGAMTPIYVRNTGTVPANVVLSSDKVGSGGTGTNSFLTNQSQPPTTDSSISFLSESVGASGSPTYAGGCTGGLQGTYLEIENSASTYPVCTNLKTHATENSVGVHFEIVIPENTVEGDTVTLTFTASQAS